MQIIPINEMPLDHLDDWRDILVEPHLVDESVLMKRDGYFYIAIPVGKIRKYGDFDLQFSGFQIVVDLLKGRPGFPNVRTAGGSWNVFWGEDIPCPKGVDFRVHYGRIFGYREEKIQRFMDTLITPLSHTECV